MDPNEPSSSDEDHVHGFHYHALHGYGGMKVPTTAIIAASMQHTLALLADIGPGIDVAEFCGGEARTTTVAIRRRLRGGRNFDLVTHTDLGDPREHAAALRYLDNALVLVMGPQCRPLGINYDTWLRRYKEDMPHASFCGRAALHQMRKGRHFIVENPWPTWLLEEPG